MCGKDSCPALVCTAANIRSRSCCAQMHTAKTVVYGIIYAFSFSVCCQRCELRTSSVSQSADPVPNQRKANAGTVERTLLRYRKTLLVNLPVEPVPNQRKANAGTVERTLLWYRKTLSVNLPAEPVPNQRNANAGTVKRTLLQYRETLLVSQPA